MKLAQVALEVALIFVVVFLFILAIIKIGVWGNAQIVGKTVQFNNTRISAGTPGRTPDNALTWPVYENQELNVGF